MEKPEALEQSLLTDRPQASLEERRHQKARLGQILAGAGLYLCNLSMLIALTWLGAIDAIHVLNYALAAVLICGFFIGMILSDINLRLRDPSMAEAVIFVAIWPSLYVMYFVSEPLARMPFLLMVTIVLLAGSMTLNLARLLRLGGVTLFAYLGLLAILAVNAPARVNLALELVFAFAYAVVIALTVQLGSQIMGMRASLARRNHQLQAAYAEMRRQAVQDTLTGLPNRLALMERLGQETARRSRLAEDGKALALALLDLDRFKLINDTHGHPVGDAVLLAAAEVLQRNVRRQDFVGRFGGEEFLLIVPDTDASGAREAAERLRQALTATPLDGLPVDRISVSIGVALHNPAEPVEATLSRADDALYSAKRQGRDQVVMADGGPGSVD